MQNTAKKLGGDFKYEHGMQPKLDAEVRKWLPPNASLPMGPLKWIDEGKEGRVIVTVGNNKGRERGEKVASLHSSQKSIAWTKSPFPQTCSAKIDEHVGSSLYTSTDSSNCKTLGSAARRWCFHSHTKRRRICIVLPRTPSDTMADNRTYSMHAYTQACKYAYYSIMNNKYYFTFEARGYPKELVLSRVTSHKNYTHKWVLNNN